MPELAGRSVDVVDVAEDESLWVRYGERLPVLRIVRPQGAMELDWPFVAADVLAQLG